MNTNNKQITRRSIYIPTEIIDRIIVLAQKKHWSVNNWIVYTLDKASKPRNQPQKD